MFISINDILGFYSGEKCPHKLTGNIGPKNPIPVECQVMRRLFPWSQAFVTTQLCCPNGSPNAAVVNQSTSQWDGHRFHLDFETCRMWQDFSQANDDWNKPWPYLLAALLWKFHKKSFHALAMPPHSRHVSNILSDVPSLLHQET